MIKQNIDASVIADRVPFWKKFVDKNAPWHWQGTVLVENGAVADRVIERKFGLSNFIVKYIYGRQNRCRSVRQVVSAAVTRLNAQQCGLNFGAGTIRYATNILNFDLELTPNADLVSAGTLQLPLRDSSLHLIISQEVLEHVDRPLDAIAEFHRTLAHDGELILQLPFIIGYHPGPTDFWRFTTEAFAQLLPPSRWKILEKRITVGHGTALHRILTEFIAIHFSVFGGRVYRLIKGLVAVLLYPLIAFDLLLPFLPEKDRIPGGYIVRAMPVK